MRSSILESILLMTLLSMTLRAGELHDAPQGSFSIAVIPDTQHYKGRGTTGDSKSREPISNPTFEAYVNWIGDNLRKQRIIFVSHVGDIVDRNEDDQWRVAGQSMCRLHGKIPYGISVGNHDMTGKGDSSLFQRYFPRSRFDEFEWYGGCFETPPDKTSISGNNANSFQLFSAAGMNFVFLHLECNAPDDVLNWADSVLKRHADRRALVTTHMGLGPRDKPKKSRDYFDAPKGRMTWKKCHGKRGNSPQQMWDKCFRKHRNLFMICCGDQSRTQALHQTARGDHGNNVYELLSDYGTNGLRVMRFLPEADRIEIRTWNPMKGALCESTSIVSDRSQHQFDLTYQMTAN